MVLAQFDELRMSETESISEFYGRVEMITNEAMSLGQPIDELLVVQKILRVLPSRFRAKKTAIMEVQNLNEIMLGKLIGKLKTYEMELNMEENDTKKSKNVALQGVHDSSLKGGEKSSAFEDEMALCLKNFRRILKKNGKFAREDSSSSERKFRPSTDRSNERNKDVKPFTKDFRKSVKCFTCGGIGHYVVDCANNMKESSNESDSDDSFEYTSSSDEETNHIALAVSIPHFISNLVDKGNEGKSKSGVEFECGDDDQSSNSDDDQSSDSDELNYSELCEKYDCLFQETFSLKEKSLKLEANNQELQHEVLTLKETKKELDDKFVFLEKEIVELMSIRRSLENQVNVLKESNFGFQNSNKQLLSELNEAKSKVISLTIGASKIDKMLNMGKLHGDKGGLGYNHSDSKGSSCTTKFVKPTSQIIAPLDTHHVIKKPKFVPTCHRCGLTGHIRPKCKSLRSESLVTKYHGFKTHVTSPNGFKNEKSSVCAAANKSSFLAKFGSPKSKMFIPTCHHCGILGHIRPRCSQLREFGKKSISHQMKRNDNSLQSQVHNLLSEVVKISRLVSLPHKVSKVKQVWIKKEDHVLPHVGD